MWFAWCGNDSWTPWEYFARILSLPFQARIHIVDVAFLWIRPGSHTVDVAFLWLRPRSHTADVAFYGSGPDPIP